MNKFGKVAIAAAERCRENPRISPLKAWTTAAHNNLSSEHMQKKCCPKCAFLALCEIGAVKGVPAGSYTSSVKNKAYTLAAYDLLRNDPGLEGRRAEWWSRAAGRSALGRNNQIEVILALKDAGLLDV